MCGYDGWSGKIDKNIKKEFKQRLIIHIIIRYSITCVGRESQIR